MSTQRHAAYTGRFRLDGTPEWFDLVDAVEAARILAGSPTAPLNFDKLNNLRARGLISAGDTSAATGPRWYRGDIERFVDTPLEPVEDPLAPARGALLAIGLGGLVLGIVAFNVWYWVVRP